MNVSQGVPQGSILGPVLYIIYVNDFPINFKECILTNYTDDTSALLKNVDPIHIKVRAEEILIKCKKSGGVGE
jgi:hypothetical protein